MINSGAIVACALLEKHLKHKNKFKYILNKWKTLTGNKNVVFNKSIYTSEKNTADRNYALAYFMKEKMVFPKDVNIHEVLDMYFALCSIETTCSNHAVVAGTLANAGVCPLTKEYIFMPTTVKHCLSLMYSCGLYDFSGEFAFKVGLPAKSGVSGALMVVIPGICGITIWSPRLDSCGNSVRGIEICNKLVDSFKLHNFDYIKSLASR